MFPGMKILSNSPEERIRVWITWLIKLADEGKRWYSWLDTHVKILQRILNFMTGEYFTPIENAETKRLMREKELVHGTMDEIVPNTDEEKFPQLHGGIDRTQDAEKKPSSPIQAIAIVNEILDGAFNKLWQWKDEEHSSEVLGTLIAFDEIPWPIGEPWVPQVFDGNREKKSKLKEMQLVKQGISHSRIKEKMVALLNQMNNEATSYRLLYKHWQQIVN